MKTFLTTEVYVKKFERNARDIDGKLVLECLFYTPNQSGRYKVCLQMKSNGSIIVFNRTLHDKVDMK
jgi:hypothetical protein